MDKIIIKACLNGNKLRATNPNIPYSPKEVADEAVRCYEAGASIVHFHARNEDGTVSYDPAWYQETDSLIRSQCDLVLNHTSARQDHIPVETVVKYLAETEHPVEMISLNLGHGARWALQPDGTRKTVNSPNSYEDILQTLDICYARGIFPEPAIHDMGDLNNAITLMNEGKIKDTHYFLVEPGASWSDGRQAMPGTPQNYFNMTQGIKDHFPESTWLAHSAGMQTFQLCSIAVATGAHIRVGFEDSPSLPMEEQPKSNASYVEWAVAMANLHGRTPMTTEEARQYLGLLPALK